MVLSKTTNPVSVSTPDSQSETNCRPVDPELITPAEIASIIVARFYHNEHLNYSGLCGFLEKSFRDEHTAYPSKFPSASECVHRYHEFRLRVGLPDLIQDFDSSILAAEDQDESLEVMASQSVECIDIPVLDGKPCSQILDISWYAGHGILHSGRALFRGWNPKLKSPTYPLLVKSLQDHMGYQEGKHIIMYRLLGEMVEVGNHAELRRASVQLISKCGNVRLKLHVMSAEKWAEVCENFDGKVRTSRKTVA
jgi:hypothetical protein